MVSVFSLFGAENPPAHGGCAGDGGYRGGGLLAGTAAFRRQSAGVSWQPHSGDGAELFHLLLFRPVGLLAHGCG